MGILFTLFHGKISNEILYVILSIAYPVAFIFVIIVRSELFTEYITLAILPVLNKTRSIKSLFILLGIILLGNLIGGYIIGSILVYFAPEIEIISNEAFTHLVHKVLEPSLQMIFVSAILAGWLVGLFSWLVASSQETISCIFMIILVNAMIGVGGLHHAIVGSIEVFTGLLIDPAVRIIDYLSFEVISVLDDALGGVFFFGVLKYG